MYKRVLVIAAVTIAMGAAWVRAQEADAVSTAIRSGVIIGSITASPTPGAGPGGACSASGYAATCPSGTCECLTITGAKVTGSLAGVGTADLNITLDTVGVTSDLAGDTCEPMFGTADLTTTTGVGKNKTARTETLNLLGAFCDNIGPSLPNTINGGFGIASSPAPSPSPAATGWGTLTGTEKHDAVRLNLKGSITQ